MPRPHAMRRRQTAVAALAGAALAALAAGAVPAAASVEAVAAQRGRALTVTSRDGARLASYTTLRCRRTRRGRWEATGRANGWELTIVVLRYRGPQTYRIGYGHQAGEANLMVARRGGQAFTNLNRPDPDDMGRLTLGGAVDLRGTRRRVGRVGVMMPIVYDDVGANASWARIAGGARCG